MANHVHARIGAAMLFCFAMCSCGGSQKPTPNTGKPDEQKDSASSKPGPKARAVTSLKLPKGVVIGDSVSLEGFYEDDMSDKKAAGGVGDASSSSASKAGDRGAIVERAGGPKEGSAVQDVYRRVAPSTVIVRSQRGYGTGVIYDPAGWILTNHHVIAHPWHEDFRWKVKVALGKLSKQGVMEKREKLYDAYVHKIAPLIDLAVIKLVNPPKDLKAVPISPKDPTPGEAVSAIGHAGIGLVWAIKDGQISAVGKLSTHLAQLMLHDPKNKEQLKSWSAKRRTKMIEAYRKRLIKSKPALVIQSTADISQGDSGGPLVNRQSELVGLNAFVRGGRLARKESNFHIHVREIRKFIKNVPTAVPQLVPDPWKDGGAIAKLGDADSDSRIDVMVLYKLVVRRLFFRRYSRRLPRAYFIDLDQDSFRGVTKLPKVQDVLEKRKFDAEFIFLADGPHLHAWYDTDNDGKPDVLLVAQSRSSKVLGGYRLDAAGKLKADPALKNGKLVRPSLFANAEHARRLEKVGSRFFNWRLLRTKTRTRYPHPVHSIGYDGTLRDFDRDGAPDAMYGLGLFARGYVLDVDQNSLGAYKKGDSARKLQGKPIDAEFSLIYQRRSQWAWYDTDDDGRFDLLLHANHNPSMIVSDAWRVSADGNYTRDTTQLGRLILQPDLLGKKHADRLRKMVRRITGLAVIGTGPGAGSFIDPMRYIGYRIQIKDTKRWRNVAVAGRYGTCQAMLVDLDRNSGRIAKRKKMTVEQLVRNGKFDAELARVQCYSSVWTFYDTRGKGRWDTILYSRRHGKGKATVVYTIDKKNNVTVRKKPIKCEGMIIPRLFRKASLRRNLMKVASDLFSRLPDARCKP
jgi:S1-C subfamily serine protease